jgi:hypothetical protein
MQDNSKGCIPRPPRCRGFIGFLKGHKFDDLMPFGETYRTNLSKCQRCGYKP